MQPAMTEVLSPELALVDPDAAEQARLALPQVTLFEDRLIRAPSEYAELRRLFEVPEEPVELEPERRRGRVLRLAALAVAVVAAAVAAVFYFAPDVRTQVGDALPASAPTWLKPSKKASPPTPTEASAPAAPVPVSKQEPPPKPPARTAPQASPTKPKSSAATKPKASARTKPKPPSSTKPKASAPTKPQAPAPTKPTPSARTIPDFVWVAAPGAAGYRVQFRRGAQVVYATTTKGPRLHVDAARLPPGKYRWQVQVLGRDAAAPIVDASVSIG
jgi:outer membrane biosynthesis protein TonB